MAVSGAGGGEVMESAGRLVDRHITADQSFYDLSGLLRVATHSESISVEYARNRF